VYRQYSSIRSSTPRIKETEGNGYNKDSLEIRLPSHHKSGEKFKKIKEPRPKKVPWHGLKDGIFLRRVLSENIPRLDNEHADMLAKLPLRGSP
jgi:hypothetical protein